MVLVSIHCNAVGLKSNQIKSNMTLIVVDKPQQLQLVKRDEITVDKREYLLNRNVNT